MKSFEMWLAEGGIPGPEKITNIWDGKELMAQSLPINDMSEQGMRNLVRYMEAAGQDVIHDSDRNAAYLKLSVKSEGTSYLVLNYNGTWHFERVVKGIG